MLKIGTVVIFTDISAVLGCVIFAYDRKNHQLVKLNVCDPPSNLEMISLRGRVLSLPPMKVVLGRWNSVSRSWTTGTSSFYRRQATTLWWSHQTKDKTVPMLYIHVTNIPIDLPAYIYVLI